MAKLIYSHRENRADCVDSQLDVHLLLDDTFTLEAREGDGGDTVFVNLTREAALNLARAVQAVPAPPKTS